jgi:hypothetical protein
MPGVLRAGLKIISLDDAARRVCEQCPRIVVPALYYVSEDGRRSLGGGLPQRREFFRDDGVNDWKRVNTGLRLKCY